MLQLAAWSCAHVTSASANEINPAFAPKGDAAPAARVIVKLRSGAALTRQHILSASAGKEEVDRVVLARTQALAQRLGTPMAPGRALSEHSHVVIATDIGPDELATRLAAQPDVEYAVVDQRRTHYAVPSDPLYLQGPVVGTTSGGPVVGQWYLHAPAGEVLSSINAQSAWEVTVGDPSIVVAVLDTGVRPEHPDLVGRLLPGYDMISDVAAANDGNGRDSFALDPGDWVSSAESKNRNSSFYQCDASNSSWHGTMTTSLIGAASNNGVGMAGVAWSVKLLPVRVLGKCGGFDSDIIAGMRWAGGLAVPGVPSNPNPARVINMSLGSSGSCSQSYMDAIGALATSSSPTLVVAAAGNSVGRAVGTPANCPGVIGVAGLRHVGTKVGFSDLGPEISISAPAGNCVNVDAGTPCLYPILAASNTGTTVPIASTYTDAFNSSVGTSFSAPLVAGTAALMLSVNPALTNVQIKSLLQGSARPFPNAAVGSSVQLCTAPSGSDQSECVCTTQYCGAGMLDTNAAVRNAAGTLPGAVSNFVFGAGWNLAGNSSASALDVAAVLGNVSKVEAVWKWSASDGRWQFFSPALQSSALADYLAAQNLMPLTLVQSGEGFWVKANQAFTASVTSVPSTSATPFAGNLRNGWNLVAVGSAMGPRQLNGTVGSISAASGVTPFNVLSLWAWNNALANWYLYSPQLDAQGGTAMGDYDHLHGYLDFIATGTNLQPGSGFWINVQ
jgi:serine protease